MDKNWHIKSVAFHIGNPSIKVWRIPHFFKRFPYSFCVKFNKPHIFRVSEGKRVRITITHMKTEQNYDKLYLTWDICDKGFHSYDTYWHGTGTSLPVSSDYN